MAAPQGNKFWKARSTHGRDRLFESPGVLWAACVEYFEWVEDNPLWENKVFHHQGTVVDHPVAKMRPMTLKGMCIFLDIHVSTWYDYASKEDFSEITTQVSQIIDTQKFEGAAADLLNPNIIARDLGLADKKEHTGADGGPIAVTQIERVIVDPKPQDPPEQAQDAKDAQKADTPDS